MSGWQKKYCLQQLAKEHKSTTIMVKYTHYQSIKITKVQKQSLKILEGYGINVSQFIRNAIKEKLSREWKQIKETKIKYPF